jgi:hypothetical protein
MRELTNKTTSIACELAALLMVVEECDVDQVERENLISLARRVSDQLAASMVEQNSRGAQWITFTPTAAKRFAVIGARGCRASVMCCLPCDYQRRGRAYPCNEFNWPWLNAFLMNWQTHWIFLLFQTLNRRGRTMISNVKFNELENRSICWLTASCS